MNCPSNTEKSAARSQFPARVSAGALSGEIGVADGAGWLHIEGRIGADGSAKSTPYAFHIDARFDAAHGTGRRLEQRVCSFAFDRR